MIGNPVKRKKPSKVCCVRRLKNTSTLSEGMSFFPYFLYSRHNGSVLCRLIDKAS